VVLDIRDVPRIYKGSYVSIHISTLLMVFDIRDAPRIQKGSYVSIFRFLPSWKVVKLLGSPERHPRSLRGRCWFLRGVLEVFDIRDAPRIHQGSYKPIFRSLPSWKVVQLLDKQNVTH
jgi:hypothetical protein